MATSTGSPVDTTDRRDHHQTRVTPKRGRLSEVPHIAGLVLGVFSVLVFLWSLSPALRYLVHTPRLYIDDYYFDAPDTSLSWAVVVGLVAAALASRKRIAWWLLTIYLTLFAVLNAVTAVADENVNAAVACVVQLAVVGILIAARKEFYTRVRRGAAWKALGVLVSGLAVGTLLGWGLVELFRARCRRVSGSCGPSTASPPSSWSRTNSSTATPTSSSTPCWDCSGRSPCSRR